MLKITDPLPVPGSKRSISIRADVDGITFLNRVQALLPMVPDWQFYEREADDFAGVHGAETLKLVYRASHATSQRAKDLICSLGTNGQTDQIEVHVRATERWLDEKLDYSVYVATAKLFESVSGAYNREYGVHLRLRIPTKGSLEPTLPPKARRLFDRMLLAARDQVLVSEGAWRAFYAFIKHTHSHRVRVSRSEFERLLILNKFADDHAQELADFYLHGRLAYPRYR